MNEEIFDKALKNCVHRSMEMSRCLAGAAEGLGLAGGVCGVELRVAIFESPAGCVMMTCSRFKPTQCCRGGLVPRAVTVTVAVSFDWL